MKFHFKLLVFLGAALTAGAFLGWLLFFSYPQDSIPKQEAPKRSATGAARQPQLSPHPLPAAQIASPSPSVPTQEQTAQTGDDQDDIISSILLREDLDHAGVSRALRQMLPILPPEQQEEAAQHMVNLTDDEHVSIWLPDLVSGQFSTETSEIFFNDLLNRPQEMSFPALATMGDNAFHPLHEASTQILEVLFGPPPAGLTWREHVQQSSTD